MPRKVQIILIGSKGEKKPVTVEQMKIKGIKWLPEVEGEDIVISFRGEVPFVMQGPWDDKADRGSSVSGNLKPHGAGTHNYFYDADGWEQDLTKNDKDIGPHTDPDLIVDGGDGIIELEKEPKPPKKSKKGKKGKKAKKAQKATKGKKTKKSAKKR